MMDWKVIFPSCTDFLERYFVFASIFYEAESAVKHDLVPVQGRLPMFEEEKFACAANMLDQAVKFVDSLDLAPSLLAAGAFLFTYFDPDGNLSLFNS